MSRVAVTIKGVTPLVQNLSRFKDEILKGVVTAAQVSQAMIVNDARAGHPYTDRTGNLTNSIQPGPVVIEESEVSAFVEARMQYASFVEYGTSRSKPYPFLTPAMLRQAPLFAKAIAREVAKIR